MVWYLWVGGRGRVGNEGRWGGRGGGGAGCGVGGGRALEGITGEKGARYVSQGGT